ncbi:hypothetical protein OQ252_02840 [Acetobacter farinalis]|uniref:Uncharacterized protein n=1 Tax=Acetobacter farinalis TaxID=1260984 RepID=A0ABT3Q4Y2_9PROT|nr:hypothetical protein [Acetobacter farinalis]MCX2560344.1 hypothetical protein [Acetobacter farinalis]NHO28999.1 hypothetical protein [Acetobacter farinalis]
MRKNQILSGKQGRTYPLYPGKASLYDLPAQTAHLAGPGVDPAPRGDEVFYSAA